MNNNNPCRFIVLTGLPLFLSSALMAADLLDAFGATAADAGDRFGAAVSVNVDHILVGAPDERGAASMTGGDDEDNSLVQAGAAYIFAPAAGSAWTQAAYLKSPVPSSGGSFGQRVVLDGDIAYVVEPGHSDATFASRGAVHIYQGSGSSWNFVTSILIPFSEAGRIGVEIAAHAGVLAIGTTRDVVYVYQANPNGSWSRVSRVAGPTNVNFGYSGLAVHNGTLLVGAPAEGAGAVYAYGGANWALQGKLTPTNPDLGDKFGSSISLSGNNAVIGAPGEDSVANTIDGDGSNNILPDTGAAFAFVRSGAGWAQEAYLKAPIVNGDDRFGESVSFFDDVAVVSSTAGSNVFIRSAGSWRQSSSIGTLSADATLFGVAALENSVLRVGSDTLAIGFESGRDGQGAVNVFKIDRTAPAGDTTGGSDGGTAGGGGSEGGGGTTGGTGGGGAGTEDWIFALDPSIAEWKTYDFVQKVSSSINSDLAKLGGGWYWGVNGTYFFVDEPYIWNESFQTWFYAVSDDSGVYYYNFTGEFWDWRSRDGERSGL